MKIEDFFDIWMVLRIDFTKFELSKGKFLPYAKKTDFWTISLNYRKNKQIWLKNIIICCGIRTHTNLAMKLA